MKTINYFLMSLRQLIFTDIFTLEWYTWKNGAKIGCLYGLIGAVYFLPLFWFNDHSGFSLQERPLCGSSCSELYMDIGFVFFLPLILMMMIVEESLFSTLLPGDTGLIYGMISMPIYGIIFGALLGGLID
jgi:hypothetical protein